MFWFIVLMGEEMTLMKNGIEKTESMLQSSQTKFEVKDKDLGMDVSSLEGATRLRKRAPRRQRGRHRDPRGAGHGLPGHTFWLGEIAALSDTFKMLSSDDSLDQSRRRS